MNSIKSPMEPLFHLTLVDLKTVKLKKGTSISVSQWKSLVEFWIDRSEGAVLDENHINIPLTNFNKYKKWLRDWETSKYSISAELISAIKEIMNEEKLFHDLLDNNVSPEIYDFDRLGLKRKLTTFQKDNVSRLLRMPNGANFSVPGAGKTTTTLVVWGAKRYEKVVGNLLVIAPRSAFEAWHEDTVATFNEKIKTSEFSNLRIDPNTSILIVNYEQLQSSEKLERLFNWVKLNNAMIAIDEAHRIKGGPNSIRWHGVRQLASVAKRIDLLTGTPMPHGYNDLKNLYSISWPNLSSNSISEKNLRCAERGGIFVRTTKNELGLPEPTLTDVFVPMGDIQSQVYSALRKNYSGTFILNSKDKSFMDRKGKAVLTLIAVATNPGLLSEIRTEDSYLGLNWPPRDFYPDENLLQLVSKYASFEIPPKYTWVSRYMKKAASEKRKVLVWSNFVGSLHALFKVLKPYNPALIYGGIDRHSREVALKKFRNDPNCHVLLTNPQTLGEGVSLHHECHDAIYVDRIYNAGLYLQSLDRIHRLGLKSDQQTRIYILNSERSIDHRVSQSLKTKIERMSFALNDPGLTETAVPIDLEDQLPSELIGLEDIDLDSLYEHLSNG